MRTRARSGAKPKRARRGTKLKDLLVSGKGTQIKGGATPRVIKDGVISDAEYVTWGVDIKDRSLR